MIRYTSLASSSAYGNAYLVEGPGPTRVLVDCGARLRRMEADLASLGVPPETIDALLITHEHSDHTYGLNLRRPFAVRHAIPTYAHPAVWEECAAARRALISGAWGRCAAAGGPVRSIVPGEETVIGSIAVRAFNTPHDARSPLGFVLSCDHTSLGIATDLGHVSAEAASHLQGCTHLVFESNHDRELETASGRPWSLVLRVLGAWGHLSNDQAADALRQLVTGRTRSVLLAHLSIDCNSPELALDVVEPALRDEGWSGTLAAAPPHRPSGWIGDPF